MKILVIDDSGVQRKMIIQIMRKAGFNQEVLEAGDGAQGIEILGRNHKDIGLILCDWNMPNMTGIQFAAGVAQVPQVAKIPFIMVTTEGTEDKVKEAYSKHPNLAGYVTKPFTPEQFKQKLEQIFKERGITL